MLGELPSKHIVREAKVVCISVPMTKKAAAHNVRAPLAVIEMVQAVTLGSLHDAPAIAIGLLPLVASRLIMCRQALFQHEAPRAAIDDGTVLARLFPYALVYAGAVGDVAHEVIRRDVSSSVRLLRLVDPVRLIGVELRAAWNSRGEQDGDGAAVPPHSTGVRVVCRSTVGIS